MRREYFLDLPVDLITVGFSGGFHNHNKGGTGSQWITVQYTDDQGRVLYHQKADGTVWDRIHIWDNPAINEDPAEKPVKIWAK